MSVVFGLMEDFFCLIFDRPRAMFSWYFSIVEQDFRSLRLACRLTGINNCCLYFWRFGFSFSGGI